LTYLAFASLASRLSPDPFPSFWWRYPIPSHLSSFIFIFKHREGYIFSIPITSPSSPFAVDVVALGHVERLLIVGLGELLKQPPFLLDHQSHDLPNVAQDQDAKENSEKEEGGGRQDRRVARGGARGSRWHDDHDQQRFYYNNVPWKRRRRRTRSRRGWS
jgi:hypothetical protein